MLFVKRSVICLLVGILFCFSFVSANVVFKTVPFQNVWVADGTSQYRMDVYAEATNYSGPVKAMFWSFAVPQSQYIHLVASSLPSLGYFYNNWGMENEQISSQVDQGFVRFNTLSAVDDGPIGREGYLGSYWFTVNVNATKGWTKFDFENNSNLTYFIDSTSMEYQLAPDLKSIPFRIVSNSTKLAHPKIAIPDVICTFSGC